MIETEEKTSPTSQNASQDKNSSNFWKELGQLLLLAIIIVVPFRLYIAQPFIVDGASMDPTFKDGDYLVVDELSYHFKNPERGSVLVFRYPKDPTKSFIKRVIGLPGETVSIKAGEVSIINEEYPDGLPLTEPYVKLEKKETMSYTLGEGEYFVMGDNRLQSADSRLWGAVPEDNIIGRPLIRFLPPSLFPGQAGNYESDINSNNP